MSMSVTRENERKKILVTGADGFIGSHLTERLVTEGADVRAFCHYNSMGSLGWLDGLPQEIRQHLDVRLGDVRDSRFVEESLADVDTVFHLAALIAIPYSYTAPESFVDTNVSGTLNVLEGARRQGCSLVVHASTSEVYGTPETLPITEDHPLRAQSPYSATKIAADKLCEAYHCSYDVPVVLLRPFNTYGPRQSMRAVIPTILVQLISGARQVRLGRLDTRRDLTFVGDTVDGFVAAAHASAVAAKAGSSLAGEVIQLGTGRDVSIREIFDAACELLGCKAEILREEKRVRPLQSEVLALRSEPTKAKKLLDWEPQVTLEEGLRVTAEWLERHIEDFDIERYHV